MEWNVFRFFGGNGCFVAATLASSAKGDNVEGGCGSGLISRGMGSKWKSLIFDGDPEHRFFVINWDHDCFMIDVNGVGGCSRSPGGPVILDVEVSVFDKGSEEVELIVVGVHSDEDDAVVGTQGEDSRGSETCAGEFMVD